MQRPDMPIELKTDITDSDIDYYVMIENRLKELAEGHTDITGAAATLEQPAKGRETPYIFEASIVVYVRPNDVSATEKANDPQQALKSALDATERQIREQRNRLKESHQ
jgi:ribosome-associated translation inhibitor RaiA